MSNNCSNELREVYDRMRTRGVERETLDVSRRGSRSKTYDV